LDIWGSFSTTSIHGFKYFLTILDGYSRHVWVVMLKFKCEASDKVKNFIHMIENQLEKKVKDVRSDNGPEFLLKDFYAEKEFYIKGVMCIHHNKMVDKQCDSNLLHLELE